MNLVESLRDGMLDLLSGLDEATISFPTTLCVSLVGGLIALRVAFDSGVRSRPQLWIATMVGIYVGSLVPVGDWVTETLRPWVQMPVFLISTALVLWLPAAMLSYLAPTNHERRLVGRWLYLILALLWILNLVVF